jgi:dephospho-CoA kinase
VGEAFPGVVKDGAIDRPALSARVLGDPQALQRLEAVVHPLVRAEREGFLESAKTADVVVFDVPLLLETGVERDVDAVVVVSAPEVVQRERVLGRPDMTETKLAQILARQIPDAEKRARADFVIDTGRGIEAARQQVLSVLAKVRSPQFRSRRPA